MPLRCIDRDITTSKSPGSVDQLMLDKRSIPSTLTVNTETAAKGINSFVIAPVCIEYAVLATTYAELQSKTCCRKTVAKSLFLVIVLNSFSSGTLRTSFRPIVVKLCVCCKWLKTNLLPSQGTAAAKAASCMYMYPPVTWWRSIRGQAGGGIAWARDSFTSHARRKVRRG